MKTVKFIGLFVIYAVCLSFFYVEKPIKVVIDAGHGGKDPGITINNISEKDIVFAISQKIKTKENENIEIILLREDDQFLTLKERVDKINSINPDLVLSLHLDKGSKELNSSRKAYLIDNKVLRKSHYQATKIIEGLNIDAKDIKLANFKLLEGSNSPALNLSLGNLAHPEDFSFLTSEEGQNQLADQIISSLE